MPSHDGAVGVGFLFLSIVPAVAVHTPTANAAAAFVDERGSFSPTSSSKVGQAASVAELGVVESRNEGTAHYPVSDRDQLADEYIGGGYGIGPPDCGSNGRAFPKTDCLWPGCPTGIPLVIESFLGRKLKVVEQLEGRGKGSGKMSGKSRRLRNLAKLSGPANDDEKDDNRSQASLAQAFDHREPDDDRSNRKSSGGRGNDDDNSGERRDDNDRKDYDEEKKFQLALSYGGPTFAFTFIDTSANGSARTMPQSDQILIKIRGGSNIYGFRTTDNEDGQEFNLMQILGDNDVDGDSVGRGWRGGQASLVEAPDDRREDDDKSDRKSRKSGNDDTNNDDNARNGDGDFEDEMLFEIGRYKPRHGQIPGLVMGPGPWAHVPQASVGYITIKDKHGRFLEDGFPRGLRWSKPVEVNDDNDDDGNRRNGDDDNNRRNGDDDNNNRRNSKNDNDIDRNNDDDDNNGRERLLRQRVPPLTDFSMKELPASIRARWRAFFPTKPNGPWPCWRLVRV